MTAAVQEVTRADGRPVAVEVDGAGPALLLVHGLGFSRRLWDPHTEALLAAGYRTVRYDLRGFGDSPPSDAPYAMSDLAADLEAVRSSLELERLHLLGHSLGGMVALQYAVEHPERLLSLTLASTTAHNGRRASAFSQAMAILSQEGFDAAMADPARRDEVETLVASAVPLTDKVLAQLRSLTTEPDPARALAWQANVDFSVKDGLTRIDCPCLVLHGDRDPWIPFGAGLLLQQALPGCRWTPFEGARHDLPAEEPERFGRKLLSFLAELG